MSGENHDKGINCKYYYRVLGFAHMTVKCTHPTEGGRQKANRDFLCERFKKGKPYLIPPMGVHNGCKG